MHKKDLDRSRKWFCEYVASFYGDNAYINANLKLKEEHTFAVCKEMAYLTEQLGLDTNNKLIAEIVALFHDIGRFRQFIEYHTYCDRRSTNHCLLALKVLKENNIFDIFEPREKKIIETAIEFHGAKQLPSDLDQDTALFAKLIRDADKLDIFRVVIEYSKIYQADPENFLVEIEFPDVPQLSPGIVQAILKGKLINYNEIQTLNDMKLMQLGWVFDVNFIGTFKRIKEQKLLETILTFLPDNNDTRKIKEVILEYVDSKIRGN